jgi:hypothetical protein
MLDLSIPIERTELLSSSSAIVHVSAQALHNAAAPSAWLLVVYFGLHCNEMRQENELQKIRLPGPAEVDILTHDDSEAEDDDSDDHKLQGITIAVLHVSGFTLKFDNSVTSNIARKHRSLLKNMSSSLRISPNKLADFHHSLTHRHGGSTWFNQGKQ